MNRYRWRGADSTSPLTVLAGTAPTDERAAAAALYEADGLLYALEQPDGNWSPRSPPTTGQLLCSAAARHIR